MNFYYDEGCKLFEKACGFKAGNKNSIWLCYSAGKRDRFLSFFNEIYNNFYVFALLLDDDNYSVNVSEKMSLYKRAFGKYNLFKLKASTVSKSTFSCEGRNFFSDISIFNDQSICDLNKYIDCVESGKGVIFFSGNNINHSLLSSISEKYFFCRSRFNFSKDKNDFGWESNTKQFFEKFYITIKNADASFFIPGSDLLERKYMVIIGDNIDALNELVRFKYEFNKSIDELADQMEKYSYYPVIPRAKI